MHGKNKISQSIPTALWRPAAVIVVLAAMLSCNSRSGSKNGNVASGGQVENTAKQTIPLPVVPAAITDPQQRADYLSEHWWDGVELPEAQQIPGDTIVEQAMVDWLDVLRFSSDEGRSRAMERFVTLAAHDRDTYYSLTEMVEHYLYDPNSPMRDEELFDCLLERIEASPDVADIDKLRPRALRERIAVNSPGTILRDFAYEIPSGKRSTMHAITAKYLLVYFYEPDCPACRMLREQLEASPAITRLLREGAIKILALYPDLDIALWRKHLKEMPAAWITARYPENADREAFSTITNTPSLYLLDAHKRVILKDARFDRLEQCLIDELQKQ